MFQNTTEKIGEEKPTSKHWGTQEQTVPKKWDLRAGTQATPGAEAQLSNNKHKALGKKAGSSS